MAFQAICDAGSVGSQHNKHGEKNPYIAKYILAWTRISAVCVCERGVDIDGMLTVAPLGPKKMKKPKFCLKAPQQTFFFSSLLTRYYTFFFFSLVRFVFLEQGHKPLPSLLAAGQTRGGQEREGHPVCSSYRLWSRTACVDMWNFLLYYSSLWASFLSLLPLVIYVVFDFCLPSLFPFSCSPLSSP